MNRRQRRANDPSIQQKKEVYKLSNAGGYGVTMPNAAPATGMRPQVNPFMVPKKSGLNVFSQTFPNVYYVEWNLTTWRQACEQAIRMGYPISYAALTSWTFECSPFVQSLFRELEIGISNVPIAFFDSKGNTIDELTTEICQKKWFKDLLKEAIHSNFWGFSCINFDPIEGKIYKYPMQDIDPINRFLKQGTFNFSDGLRIEEHANLLFFQPSTNYESFLGWMQPITRSFIQMNLNKNNWVGAGRRLAFPLMMVGYQQADQQTNSLGEMYNPSKLDAETILAEADPTNGICYPYTIGPDGKMIKALDVDFADTKANAQAYKLYSDFNKEEKNDIREMIMTSTLTSSGGDKGSYSLGSIHMDKYESAISYTIENACAMLNDEFLRKLRVFYKNIPKDVYLAPNKAKEWSLDEVVKVVPILEKSGKKLTSKFFENMGLGEDFIKDAPITEKETPEFIEPETEMATNVKRTLFGGFKKKS